MAHVSEVLEVALEVPVALLLEPPEETVDVVVDGEMVALFTES